MPTLVDLNEKLNDFFSPGLSMLRG